MSWSEADVRAMHARYEGGLTLKDLAEANGITVERVRQLFAQYGLARRSTEEVQRRRTDALQERALAERERIIALYKEHGNLSAVLAEVDLPRTFVTPIVDSIPNREAYRHRGRRTRVPHEKLQEDLRAAAKLMGTPMTTLKYREAARRLKLAAADTQTKAFGSLKQGYAALGIDWAISRSTGQRPDFIPLEDCIAAVAECAREFGQRPSFVIYDAWAKDNGKPSAVTIRKKAGSWNRAVALALESITPM